VPGQRGRRVRTWVAPGVCRSGRDVGPRGERLEASWSTVRSCYGAREGTRGSGSLGQGSKEHVTSWSVTAPLYLRVQQ
jgi:hypothetical protein